MKNNDKIPILVNCNGKVVRIMQIIFDDNNSMLLNINTLNESMIYNLK